MQSQVFAQASRANAVFMHGKTDADIVAFQVKQRPMQFVIQRAH